MDELEAIERLHALKLKGLLTDEEFASEKERVFAEKRAIPSGSAGSQTSELQDEQSRYSEGYGGDRRGKIVVGLVGLGLLAGGVWWAIGTQSPFEVEDEPLEEYIIGDWVSYRPNEPASVLCGTDTGITFEQGWSYSEFDTSGSWAVDGSVVEVTVGEAITRYEISRQGENRAQFTYESEEGPRIWDAFRCPHYE